MLQTALARHSQLRCLGEIFNPDVSGNGLRGRSALDVLWERGVRDRVGFIGPFLRPRWPKVARKRREELVRLCRLFRVPVLILRRQRLVRRLASEKIGARTRKWQHFGDPTQAQEKGETHRGIRVAISLEELQKDVLWVDRQYQEFGEWFPWGHEVLYEDLCRDWSGTMRGVLEYLGVPEESLCPGTLRQDSRPLGQVVRNWDVLYREALSSEDVRLREVVELERSLESQEGGV